MFQTLAYSLSFKPCWIYIHYHYCIIALFGTCAYSRKAAFLRNNWKCRCAYILHFTIISTCDYIRACSLISKCAIKRANTVTLPLHIQLCVQFWSSIGTWARASAKSSVWFASLAVLWFGKRVLAGKLENYHLLLLQERWPSTSSSLQLAALWSPAVGPCCLKAKWKKVLKISVSTNHQQAAVWWCLWKTFIRS